MTTCLSPAEVLPFLHGCSGTCPLDGHTLFTRFTEEELAYYSERSNSDFLRSHTLAGIFLECVTDAPEISFTYQMYREKGLYAFGSGFDIWEDGVLAAVYAIDPECTDTVTVSYTRKKKEPSRIRIHFTGGSVVLLDKFCLGNAVSVEKSAKTILFYGDSITQSAYVPAPSLSWPHLLSRWLDAEFINRGIGSMIFEAPSLPSAPDCTPDLLCIEYGCNDIAQIADNETALANALAWLEKICVLYPAVPKCCILPDFIPREGVNKTYWERLGPYARELAAICSGMNIPTFSGRALIPEISSLYYGDHIHFNEAGSSLFAGNLLHTLRHIPSLSL